MSEEFGTYVECPHCGHEQHETIPFNFMEADPGGCSSHVEEFECFGCFKKFWLRAYVSFDVDISDYWTKKPKDKNK
ncbi:MAG: hypothetical protein ACXVCP_00290 [Bdellovibrio sp.]